MREITAAFTEQELQVIAEIFHEYAKEDPGMTVYEAIERKAAAALART